MGKSSINFLLTTVCVRRFPSSIFGAMMDDSTIQLSGEPLHLQARRLYLRDLQPGDLAPMVALRGDPRVAAGLHIPLRAREESRAWFRRALRDNGLIPRRSFHLAARTMEAEHFLGWVYLGRARTGDGNGGWYELSYALLPQWWGQDLATEAVRCALRLAFLHVGAEGIFADFRPQNRASERVLQKAQFQPAGRAAGGCFRYVLEREAWERRVGAEPTG